MNPIIRTLRAVPVVAALAIPAGPSLAQPDTQEFCTEALTAEAPDWFAEQLDAAEQALERGDLGRAQRALGTAATELPRTADVSVHSKCVGEDLYARYLDVGRRITALRAEQNPDDWAAQVEAGVAAGTAPARIADLVPVDARAFDTAVALLGRPTDTIANDSERGYFVLDVERAEAETATAAAAVLRERAGAQIAALLEREEDAFTGPVTDGEADLASAVGAAESIAAGLTGVEPLPGRAETRELLARTGRSLDVLGELEDWLDVATATSAAAAYERAETRGDALLAAARRESYAYTVRDELYDEAIDYYEHARAESKLETADGEQEAIQPALDAEREQRRQAADAARERLSDDAEALRDGAEGLTKSDEERREFEEEADALEAELGF